MVVPRFFIRQRHVSALLRFCERCVSTHFIRADARRIENKSIRIQSLGVSNATHLWLSISLLGCIFYMLKWYRVLIVPNHLLVCLIKALFISNGGARTLLLKIQNCVLRHIVARARVLQIRGSVEIHQGLAIAWGNVRRL